MFNHITIEFYVDQDNSEKDMKIYTFKTPVKTLTMKVIIQGYWEFARKCGKSEDFYLTIGGEIFAQEHVDKIKKVGRLIIWNVKVHSKDKWDEDDFIKIFRQNLKKRKIEGENKMEPDAKRRKIDLRDNVYLLK